MNTIDILIEGYARIKEKGWEASGTTCLITTDTGAKIITDPGANRDLLLEKLSEKGLTVGDIQMVFLTHHHLDHAMNVGIFPNAKVIDEEAIYTQDKAEEGVEMLPDTDITILPTPGHEAGHGVLVVPTAQGTVVVAGDNFWFEEGQQEEFVKDGKIIDVEKLLHKPDNFAEDMDVLIESRKKVLELANWVVPGHGKVFEVKK